VVAKGYRDGAHVHSARDIVTAPTCIQHHPEEGHLSSPRNDLATDPGTLHPKPYETPHPTPYHIHQVLSDELCDRSHRPREPMPDFLKHYFIRQYGLKSIALKNLANLAVRRV
jgi:hypothetical protein